MVAEGLAFPAVGIVLFVAIACLLLYRWIAAERRRSGAALSELREQLQREREQRQRAELSESECQRRLALLDAEVSALRMRMESQTADLDTTRERARDASRTKSLFVANMSHELRTPLNGILGLTRNLLDATLTPRQRAEVELIQLAGEDLMRIVNDVLDLSKLESGKMELERIPFNLPELLESIFALLYPQAERKQLSYAICYSHLVQRRFLGDPFRIRQVAVNLLSNAIKFTSSGSIQLRLEEERRTAGITWVRISVQDTGIGIEPNKLAMIFDEFQQADLSTTRKYGGTGLGLSLSRHIVELLGGEISVESEPDRGSVFHVSMPLKPIAALNDEGEEGAERRSNPLEGIRLLVQRRHTPESQALMQVLGCLPGLVLQGFEQMEELPRSLGGKAAESAEPWDALIAVASSPALARAEVQQSMANWGAEAPILIVLNDTAAEGESAWWSALRSVELAVPVLPSQLINILLQLREVPLGPLFESAGMTFFDVYTGAVNGRLPAPPRMLVAHENPIQLRLLEGMAAKLGMPYYSASDSGELLRQLKEQAPGMLLVQENLMGARAAALLNEGRASGLAGTQVILIGEKNGRVESELTSTRVPVAVVPPSPRLAQIREALEKLAETRLA